ncbi:hypothetical protein [Sulfitobacter undariae]|nr:hypothetical protein [Sulfitobacter undariae]
MKTVLHVGLVLMALFVGAILALLVLFSGPTLYGLRPHAVRSDLDRHTVGALVSLKRDGPVSAVITYDGWYRGRDGQSGWFVSTPEDIENIEFAVNGELDPLLARNFGSNPRRCSGKDKSRKVIRAIEPERRSGGFLGRSTCDRKDMDLSAVIAASAPATRTVGSMSYTELEAFDRQTTKPRWREYVQGWPTPYAYQRTISLPLIWQSPNAPWPAPFRKVTTAARELADGLQIEGKIEISIGGSTWLPQTYLDDPIERLPIRLGTKTTTVTGIEVKRIDIVILCAPDMRAACDAVDVEALSSLVAESRDDAHLAKAIANATPFEGETPALRDILNVEALTRTAPLTPVSKERQFSVTWFERNLPKN